VGTKVDDVRELYINERMNLDGPTTTESKVRQTSGGTRVMVRSRRWGRQCGQGGR
jgi:hypothetical protein